MMRKLLKKLIYLMVIFILCFSFVGCKVMLPEDEFEKNPPQYRIDFENNNIEYLRACFDEEFTPESLSIEKSEQGFNGNVLKCKVTMPSPEDTWWVSGIKFLNNNTDKKAYYTNLDTISLKYKSTVAYDEDVQFIIQMVWKENRSEREIAAISVDFPIEKTADVKTFSFKINNDEAELLNNAENYYLDWVMIGLESGAGELFHKGVFFVDDISFYGKSAA